MSNVSKTINGTFGRVWVDDEDYGMVRSFEVKATLDWEAINEPEKLGPGYKYKGYALEGTLTGMQIDSRFSKNMLMALSPVIFRIQPLWDVWRIHRPMGRFVWRCMEWYLMN